MQLLILLSESLIPGQTHQSSMDSQQVLQLDLTYNSTQSEFELVVEPSIGSLVGYFCEASITSIEDCKKSPQGRVIPCNVRYKIASLPSASYRLFIKNEGVPRDVFVTYEDSIFLLPGRNYDANGPLVFRVPVCSDVDAFNIVTNLSSAEQVNYSFTNGRPTTQLPSFTNIAPQFPGFLYLSINATGPYQLQVWQYQPMDFRPESAYKASISSYRGCYRYFVLQSATSQLTAAASEIDGASIYDMNLYYRSNFDGNNFASESGNDGSSSMGLFKTAVQSGASSEITVRTQQALDYLPHQAHESKNYEMYFFQLYATSQNDGFLPAQEVQFQLNNKQITYVIPFKATKQATSLSDLEPSSYVVQATFDEATNGTPALQFGHEDPDDSSFQFTQLGNIYQSIAFYDESSDYWGDLFYGKVSCDGFYCSGKFRAEHLYRLSDRTEITFAHMQSEADQFYYMYYELLNGGLDVQIKNQNQNIRIFVSQYAVLPNDSSANTTVFNCQPNQECHISFRPGELEDYSNVYIGIESQSSVAVIAAKFGENIIWLTESQPQASTLLLGENQSQHFEYLFDFNTLDYQGKDITKKYTVLAFEAANLRLDKLPSDLDILLYASFEASPGPDNYVSKMQLSAGQFIKDADDLDLTRMQMRVLNNYGGKLHLALLCSGLGCRNDSVVKLIRFQLTAYTVNQLVAGKVDVSGGSMIPIQNRTDINYFLLQEGHIAEFNIFAPTDPVCDNISYKMYICAGVVPTLVTLNTIGDTAFCKQRNLTAQGHAKLEFDTMNDNVASGFMYVALSPDFTGYMGDRAKITKCAARYVLYDSELISDFQLPTHGELYYAGANNGKFYVARVPTVAGVKSSAESPFGDRLAVKISATQSVQICISDVVGGFYPTEIQRNCINTEVKHQNDQFTVDFKNYKNQAAVGKLVSHTLVYISVYTTEAVQASAPLFYNLTIAPQTVVKVGAEATPVRYISGQFYGSERFLNYAFDLSGLSKEQLSLATLFTGPYCNDSYCRSQGPAAEFYSKAVITTLSQDDILPVESSGAESVYNNGVQLTNVQEHIKNLKNTMLYVTVEYRWSPLLSRTNRSSQMAYYAQLLANTTTNVKYQSTQAAKNAVVAHFSTQLAYVPAEIVLYPCRGFPALLLDQMAPFPLPQAGDYQVMLQNSWGKPISYQIQNATLGLSQQFMTVFDANSFDFDANEFISTQTNLSYELFVGSQAEQYRPGNAGQITVVDYSSKGNGRVKVRFAPAAAPNQEKNVAPVNYTLYALPYHGSFESSQDYSPYTACGVSQAGYAVYKNGDNVSINYDVDQVAQNGYIEVESNQPLWTKSLGSGQVIYVTVLAGHIAYQGVLAGNDQINAQAAVAITFAVVLVVICVLLLVFYFVYFRHRKQKTKGYKPMLR